MENEQVTIALTVAQWQAILNALGYSPYVIVNPINPIIAELQQQADLQIAEINQRSAETAQTDAGPEATQN